MNDFGILNILKELELEHLPTAKLSRIGFVGCKLSKAQFQILRGNLILSYSEGSEFYYRQQAFPIAQMAKKLGYLVYAEGSDENILFKCDTIYIVHSKRVLLSRSRKIIKAAKKMNKKVEIITEQADLISGEAVTKFHDSCSEVEQIKKPEPTTILEAIKQLAADKQVQVDPRMIIRPLSPLDRAQKCKCGHYKRYHDREFEGVMYCRYDSCSCRGYKEKQEKSRQGDGAVSLQDDHDVTKEI
jgi:hypothetical protein